MLYPGRGNRGLGGTFPLWLGAAERPIREAPEDAVSQFEYVSVAIALIYALAVGRVLAGITPALAPTRRYSVHAAWLVHILLVCATQWWLLWRTSTVEWTALKFVWILALPSLQYVRAAILLGTPESVPSYREHFFGVRRTYFAVSLAVPVHSSLTLWVLGQAPWFTFTGFHLTMLPIAGFCVVGLASSRETVHRAVVGLALLFSVAVLMRSAG